MPESPQQKPMDRDQAHSHEVRRCSPRKKSPRLDHKTEPEVFVVRFPDGWAYCIDGKYSDPVYPNGVVAWEAAERFLENGR